MLEMDACDIYQPEPALGGGITETMSIINLVGAFNRKVYLASVYSECECTYYGGNKSCSGADDGIPADDKRGIAIFSTISVQTAEWKNLSAGSGGSWLRCR